MKNKETIHQFYHLHGQVEKSSQFNAYKREEFACDGTSLPSNRRDFYKISLVTNGKGVLSHADKSIQINDAALLFMNPMIPYSWEPTSVDQTGYFCLFTENFIDSQLKNGWLSDAPLFKAGGEHVFIPDPQTMTLLSGLFNNILQEMHTDYAGKYDLIKNYIRIIMHEALKMQPPENYFEAGNASARISNMFTELLERQFPIESNGQVLRLKNAAEFASQLSVHTNHLNRSLKEIKGKTTTELINERVLKESKALLLHSNWGIAQLGHCLGFEHSSNFNTFFKKQTGLTPSQFRNAQVVNS